MCTVIKIRRSLVSSIPLSMMAYCHRSWSYGLVMFWPLNHGGPRSLQRNEIPRLYFPDRPLAQQWQRCHEYHSCQQSTDVRSLFLLFPELASLWMERRHEEQYFQTWSYFNGILCIPGLTEQGCFVRYVVRILHKTLARNPSYNYTYSSSYKRAKSFSL